MKYLIMLAFAFAIGGAGLLFEAPKVLMHDPVLAVRIIAALLLILWIWCVAIVVDYIIH